VSAPRPGQAVLVVDDEVRVRRSLAQFLEDEGFEALEAGTTDEARRILADRGDDVVLVLLDVWMPGGDGLQFLEANGELLGGRPVVVMSGHGNIDMAVRAIRHGAFDFLEKPVTAERLTVTVERALEMGRLKRERDELRVDVPAGSPLIGSGEAIEKLRAQVARVAASDSKVLILGENGTGKELVARQLHDRGPRRDQPFVRVNSAAIPRDLVESELFGHEKGAFTGATAPRKGKMELAHRGSLFLDEIGDMSLEAQAKLLRAIETGEVERLGGQKTLVVDVRLIAATNKDLKSEIRAGRFREDLYYRLNVVPIVVPPLRDRTDDIGELIAHFMARQPGGAGRPRLRFTKEAMARLEGYAWPGNVRELRNAVERLAILADGDQVDALELARHLPELDEAQPRPEPGGGGGTDDPAGHGEAGDAGDGDLRRAVEVAEKKAIREAIDASGGNMSEAARRLGIDRANLYRKLKRYQMDRKGDE
jgi:two-component system nitrogen regulation response regulator NtrX